MNISKGVQLVNNFIHSLNTYKGISVTPTPISRNVFEFQGLTNCLLYTKGRSERPYRWGVTANVIYRLQAQPKRWYVILLFESYDKGYVLNAADVNYYIRAVWPLGKDGDYKPSPGSYLSKNVALHSIKDFIKIIDNV